MTGLFAALIASVFVSAKDLCSKSLASSLSATLSAICSFGFAIPFYLVALLVLIYLDIPVLALGATFYCYVLLRASSDMGAEWCRMLAMKHGDVSLVSGFIALNPLFLLIVSPIITGDRPTLLGAVGVCITTFGVFVLAGKRLHWKESQTGILYAIAGAFFFSLNSCFDRLATLQAHPVVSGFWMTFVALIFLLIAGRNQISVSAGAKFPWAVLIARGVFEFLFMSSKLWALQYYQAPYVAALTKIALLITILGGGVLFGEKHLKRRFIGGCIIVSGAALVVLKG